MDNRDGRYASAATALNAGATGSQGEFLIFIHQDVALLDQDFLSRAEAMLRALPELGAAGVAGARAPDHGCRDWPLNMLLTGEPPGHTDENFSHPLTEPTEAQTVDELMLIVPAAEFRQQPFDESTCDNWHMYAVDYCLSALTRGKRVYVLPLLVHHYSTGSINAGYFRTLSRVARKHRRYFRRIYTTCGPWSTRLPASLQRVITRGPSSLLHRFRIAMRRLGLMPQPVAPKRNGAL